MDKPIELIEKLIERGEDYGKTSIELLKLKTIDKSANLVSNIISWSVIILFALLFFTLLNIAVALWVGDLLGNKTYGFFIVAGFYGLFTLVFLIFRKQLVKNPLNNSMVKQLLD